MEYSLVFPGGRDRTLDEKNYPRVVKQLTCLKIDKNLNMPSFWWNLWRLT